MSFRLSSTPESGTTKVLLALKCPVTLAGFDYILRTGIEGIDICGKVRSPDAVRQACQRFRPDMLVIDTWVERSPEFSLIRSMAGILPGLRTVLMHRKINAEALHAAVRAGVLVHVTEEDAVEAVLDAVIQAREGKVHLGTQMASQLVHGIANGQTKPHPRLATLLTDREYEVFKQRARCQSVKELAFSLRLSIKTVEGHLAKIRKKLGVSSNADLHQTAWALLAQEESPA